MKCDECGKETSLTKPNWFKAICYILSCWVVGFGMLFLIDWKTNFWRFIIPYGIFCLAYIIIFDKLIGLHKARCARCLK